MKQYVQTDLEADREVANTLADLIIGGLLARPRSTTKATGIDGEVPRDASLANPLARAQAKGPVPLFENRASGLGSGGRI